MDDLADAIALLLERRAAHLEQVERIDTALTALGARSDAASPTESRDVVPARSGMSARDKAVRLADEADRDWNTAEILAEWERRGDPVTGANPDNSMRAALSVAFQQGQLYRTTPGRYKSTKFRPPQDDLAPSHDPSSNGQASQEEVPFATYQD